MLDLPTIKYLADTEMSLAKALALGKLNDEPSKDSNTEGD